MPSRLGRLRARLIGLDRRPPTPPGTDQDQPTDVVAEVDELLRDRTPESEGEAVRIGRATDAVSTPDLGPLAARFLVTGHRQLARELVEEADRRGTDVLGRRQRLRLDHLRQWTHPADVPEPPPDAVHVGVFYYRQPDRGRGSSNIGDYVQTLSMLGNLARFSDLELSGVDGIGALATELQSRVRPELRLASPRRRVNIVPVSRDFSDGDPIPDGTWLFAFGWHLHASFGLRYGLPYHPGLRPLFVSFHLHAIDALDQPTIDYLRDHGPVGCRDWTTVDLLLSAGVDAFFTGCVTTTVDAVFPTLDSVDRSGAGAIGVIDTPDPDDLPSDQPVTHIKNGDRRHRELDLVSGTRTAIDVLEDYQRRLDRVVTSRLHAYLPATTLGLEVDLRQTIPGDGRYTGLRGLRPGSTELVSMRDGIRDLIADTLARILAEASVDDVYAAWRARAAPLVDQARVRHLSPPPPCADVSTADVSSRLHHDPPTPVDSGDPAIRRAAVWTLRPGATAVDVLALPALLPDLDRLVVSDPDDALPEAEVARLTSLDLRGNPVGARLSTEAAAHVWRRAAHRLAPEPAAELRRLMSARHPFLTRAMDPGPLVLDLARMRADPDLSDCLALAAHFSLGARDALLAYAGPRVTPLAQPT